MIIAKDWIWLHVPKCAGTTTELLLREVYGLVPEVKFDVIDLKDGMIWHQSVKERLNMLPEFDVGHRMIVGNIRRLPTWLLSRIHFEVQRSGSKSCVTREELLKGMFRNGPNSDGSAGEAFRADVAMTKFSSEVTRWIRSENLVDDLSAAIGFDSKVLKDSAKRANVGKIEYVRDLNFWFTRSELESIYAANPIWAGLEEKVYGDLLTVG